MPIQIHDNIPPTQLADMAGLARIFMQADSCDIWVADRISDSWNYHRTINDHPTQEVGPRPNGWTAFVLHTHSPVWISLGPADKFSALVWNSTNHAWNAPSEIEALPAQLNHFVLSRGFRNQLAIPLITGDAVCWGVLWANYQRQMDSPPSANYIEIAEAFRGNLTMLHDFISYEGSFRAHNTFELVQPDDTVVAKQKNIIYVGAAIDARLISYFKHNPEQMHMLSARQFEELIAELLIGFGFDVELTPETRDGGKDIIATQLGIAAIKYVVECKRYDQNNPVGISIVQRLHGVTMSEGATKGIIATTSRLTKPSWDYINDRPWILEGRDFDGLIKWLQLYRNVRPLRK